MKKHATNLICPECGFAWKGLQQSICPSCDAAEGEQPDENYYDDAPQPDYGGAFDGFSVTSDADPGL